MPIILTHDGPAVISQPAKAGAGLPAGSGQLGGQGAGRGRVEWRVADQQPVVEHPVAEAIVYLAGASFITGTVLECTGGSNLTAAALAS
jgi:hypothetical protein